MHKVSPRILQLMPSESSVGSLWTSCGCVQSDLWVWRKLMIPFAGANAHQTSANRTIRTVLVKKRSSNMLAVKPSLVQISSLAFPPLMYKRKSWLITLIICIHKATGRAFPGNWPFSLPTVDILVLATVSWSVNDDEMGAWPFSLRRGVGSTDSVLIDWVTFIAAHPNSCNAFCNDLVTCSLNVAGGGSDLIHQREIRTWPRLSFIEHSALIGSWRVRLAKQKKTDA